MTNMIFYPFFCPIAGAKAAITWSAPGWNHMTTPILQSYELDLFCSGGADPGPKGRPVAAWVKKYLTSENSKWPALKLQSHEARRAAIIWRRHSLKSHEARRAGITWERAAVHMIEASLYNLPFFFGPQPGPSIKHIYVLNVAMATQTKNKSPI